MSFAQPFAPGCAAQFANQIFGGGDADIRDQQGRLQFRKKRLIDGAAGEQIGEVGIEDLTRSLEARLESRAPARARFLV